MGYRITYGRTGTPRKEKSKSGTVWIFFGMIVVFLVFSAWIWPQMWDELQELLFPMADAVTAGAFEEMVRQVGTGTSVGEAIIDFCREIIENAPTIP